MNSPCLPGTEFFVVLLVISLPLAFSPFQFPSKSNTFLLHNADLVEGNLKGDLPVIFPFFIIYMETLTTMPREKPQKKKSGIGFKITPSVGKLPCLLFAYDSLIFCKN